MPSKNQTGGSKKPKKLKKTKYVPATSVGGRVTKPSKKQADRTTKSLLSIAAFSAGGRMTRSAAESNLLAPVKMTQNLSDKAAITGGIGLPAVALNAGRKITKTKTYKPKAKPIKVKLAKSTYQLKKKKG